MALSIFFVQNLADVVQPAAAFLSRPLDDLFARQRIVVPNAGAKAWLVRHLARELGSQTRNGQSLGDGIVANISISFPGTLMSLLQPSHDAIRPDPWAFDRLTFTVLAVMTAADAVELAIPFDVSREPLLAARRIAGLFDAYHVKRPGMIREWHLGNPVLEPTASDGQQLGATTPSALGESDQWQFRVWQAVRGQLGEDQPPPPLRQSVSHQPNHERLLVAGLEHLSLPQLACLEELATVCDVEAYVIHPSPGLRERWKHLGLQPLPASLRDRPLQKDREPEIPSGVDSLLPAWLAATRDLQTLLAARGTPVTAIDRPAAPRPKSLLAALQQTVHAGGEAAPFAHDPTGDRSVVIHRCHSLSRQAEVLHDALLQAFQQIDGLKPHEVAIVSPCIQKAAPHLKAVFQRTAVGQDASGAEQRITLPLVVADRCLRETSEAADLLVKLLHLPESRGSIADVLAVAGHPVVRAALGVSEDTVATWNDCIERTVIRWGFTADHRQRRGLDLQQFAPLHTWQHGLERMLLGSMLNADDTTDQFGGVLPLEALDTVDLSAISKLARILDTIRSFEAATEGARSAGDWCDTIEQALHDLCGAENPQLGEPLAMLRRLRRAASGTTAEKQAVPFPDVAQLLTTWLDEQAGRQPLETGDITATSMVPLRGVPFRVICVIGYDDDAVGTAAANAGDLIAQQPLLGDGDSRSDERRALLDCLLAAEERLIITCNGRSMKSNKRLPLVTPLAEFVDFAVRHGVAREKFDEASGIEINHPRHHLSRRNFEEGGVEPTGIWSHDTIARAVLVESAREVVQTKPESQAAAVPKATGRAVRPETFTTDLATLEMLAIDPLRLFLTRTLGISTWRITDPTIPATLPLEIKKKLFRELVLELAPLAQARPDCVEEWLNALPTRGVLPFGHLGLLPMEEIFFLALGIAVKADEAGIPLSGHTVHNATIKLVNNAFRDVLPGIDQANRRMVMVFSDKAEKSSFGRPLHAAAIRLVAAKAAGLPLDSVSVVSRHNNWSYPSKPGSENAAPPCIIRTVKLDGNVDPLERLAEWNGLAAEATRHPRGLFNLRDTTPQDLEARFESFVTQSYNGKIPYHGTNEAIVYGLSPVFADIFDEGSHERAFLEHFSSAFRFNTRGSTYTLV
jgi:exodeoxyribonuclease V gamma subunit